MERVVNVVTGATSSVIGDEKDGVIRAKMEGNKWDPTFEAKSSNYKSNM